MYTEGDLRAASESPGDFMLIGHEVCGDSPVSAEYQDLTGSATFNLYETAEQASVGLADFLDMIRTANSQPQQCQWQEGDRGRRYFGPTSVEPLGDGYLLTYAVWEFSTTQIVALCGNLVVAHVPSLFDGSNLCP
jgi:hypothetical protein